MLNYHIVVTGRVQGVGFRWSTHELALQHGLVPTHMPKLPACESSHAPLKATGRTLKCSDLVEVARF